MEERVILTVSCDTCLHSYFNGVDYLCGCGLSRYYGMGMLSRRKTCCELHKVIEREKRINYGR